MSAIFALIVTSCTFGSEYCVQQKTYYRTEQECGAASDRVAQRVAVEKPKAKVIYFCLEQDLPTSQASAGASPAEVDLALPALQPTARAAWGFLRS